MLRYIKFLIFPILLLSCQKEVIDESYYDYPDQVAEIELQDYPTRGVKTEFLNIHCTASKEGVDIDGEWLVSFFTRPKNQGGRGWSRSGYNFIILLDGTIETLIPIDYDGYTQYSEISNGVYVAGQSINSKSINIAYVGGVDRFLAPKDTRTIQQKESLNNLVQTITCRIPNLKVIGHRDHNGVSKACPSFDVEKEYGYLNPILNETNLFDHEDNEF